MAFLPGNNLWTLRDTHGRDKEYENEQQLIDGILSYADWVIANPWYKTEQLKKPVLKGVNEKGEKVYETIVNIPTARPMSIDGLCDHLCIHHKTWKRYGKSAEFGAIVARTEQFIRTQQFEGAAVGVFHQAIIAPTLGLINKQETGFRDKDGNPTDPPKPIVITSIFPDTEKDI